MVVQKRALKEKVFDSLGYVTALTRWINRKIMRKKLVSGN
jgi:hypothetical protein